MQGFLLTIRTSVAAAISLHAFWILLFLKESSAGVAKFLTIHQGVGPLSGLFLFSALIGFAAFFLLHLWRPKEAVRWLAPSGWLLLISTLVFLVLVFPPVFHSLLR